MGINVNGKMNYLVDMAIPVNLGDYLDRFRVVGTVPEFFTQVYLDLDTLRPDHLGCYGYHRNTSPHIDQLASEGVRFDNCYASDAPCLPSRAAFFNGRFGIHTGAVGHGGTAADLRIEGAPRSFGNAASRWPWVMAMARQGIHTASVSPYAERHGAWWFYHGFREMYNTGKRGGERQSNG